MNCTNCTHYSGPSVEGFEYISHACKAFPMGIPEDLFHDAEQHLSEIPGDNGIRFQKK